MKELTQLRFEVKILTENRALVGSRNCAELYKSGRRISGVYTIDPDGSGAFNVYCDQTTANGGWTVIQKRMDGSVDFNRTWNEYKHGFGNLVGEFWLGLDKINRLTRNKTKNKLRVDLGVTTGKTVHPEYDWFGIGNETAKYRLYIGNITNATVSSDSLGPHRNLVFGTWDREHVDCAQRSGRGWWYGNGIKCAVFSNLNGIYPRCERKTSADIHWAELDRTSAEGSAPSSTEMKIRPVDF
ncbi:angiopoietin-related protein 7-like isoform X2 [Pocillopora verrucosa]